MTRPQDEKSIARVPRGSKKFYLLEPPNLLWGARNLVFNEHWHYFPGLQRPERDSGHSHTYTHVHLEPLFSVSGAIIFLSPCAFTAEQGQIYLRFWKQEYMPCGSQAHR
jgi:hypothetical protein